MGLLIASVFMTHGAVDLCISLNVRLFSKWICPTSCWKISVTWTVEKLGGVMSGFWWVWADNRRDHNHLLSCNHRIILLIRLKTGTYTVSPEPLRFHQSRPLCPARSTCPKSVCVWETARPAGCPSSSGSYTDCGHAWPPHVWSLHAASELYLQTRRHTIKNICEYNFLHKTAELRIF